MEYRYVFATEDGLLYQPWWGSCYGMSALTLLAKNGLFPYSQYKSGATSLHELNYPTQDRKISSLITYYQMLQVKDVIQNQYRTVPSKSNEQNIKKILSELENHETVLVGFQKAGWGGHAIIATGVDYGSYTWNDVTYQGCIRICDPNASMGYNNRCNIYFNTKSYNWTIPFYSGMSSVNGAAFNYVGANVNDINDGGYLSGTSNAAAHDFVARHGNAFSRHGTVNDVADALDVRMEIGELATDLGVERGVRGHACNGAPAGSLFDFAQVSSVQKEFHRSSS